MDFVPYRELRNEPTAVRKKLAEQGELVVTVDGKPFAMMVDLQNADNLEEMVKMISRFKAQRALLTLRAQARKDGLDKMTDNTVDAVIQKTRSAR